VLDTQLVFVVQICSQEAHRLGQPDSLPVVRAVITRGAIIKLPAVPMSMKAFLDLTGRSRQHQQLTMRQVPA